MPQNNDLVFLVSEKNNQTVSDIECEKALKDGIVLAASKLRNNPPSTQYGLTLNYLKALLESNKSSILVKSDNDIKKISFEDSLPLFTDYFAKINTQTDKTSNEKDVVFHTEPNDPTKVSAIESDKFFMDELRFKANKMFENPSLDTFNLTYNSLKSSIENDNRRLLIQSTEDKKQISFEEALPLFSDYMASLNLNANKDTPLVTTFGIEPGATDPATIKKDNIRCLY